MRSGESEVVMKGGSAVTSVSENEKIAEMVNELKEKRDKYADEIEGVLSYKSNSNNFRYKTNTLLTNLVLDEIYRERNFLL